MIYGPFFNLFGGPQATATIMILSDLVTYIKKSSHKLILDVEISVILGNSIRCTCFFPVRANLWFKRTRVKTYKTKSKPCPKSIYNPTLSLTLKPTPSLTLPLTLKHYPRKNTLKQKTRIEIPNVTEMVPRLSLYSKYNQNNRKNSKSCKNTVKQSVSRRAIRYALFYCVFTTFTVFPIVLTVFIVFPGFP